jgi:hypothetical protein
MSNKTLPVAFVLGACLSLAACGGKTPDAAPTSAAAPAAAPAADASTAVPDAAASAPGPSVLSPWTGDLAAAQPDQLCALDALNGIVAADGKFALATGQAAVFDGWVATSDMRSAPSFSLVLDGASDFQINGGTGIARDDVAKAYSNDQLATAGFRLELPALSVPAGDYTLVIAHQEAGVWKSCDTREVLTVN